MPVIRASASAQSGKQPGLLLDQATRRYNLLGITTERDITVQSDL
jgi:hypothetical protein